MPLREIAPKLSPEQYEKNFADIDPALSPRQAAIEAARCLYCFDAPCTAACPTHIDVPAFIKKISTGNLHRLGARDSLRQYSRPKLRPRVPHRSALRRRLRDARKGRGSHRNRPPAALRRGLRARSRSAAVSSAARQTASASPASARAPLRSPAPRSWPSGATTLPFSIARKIPAASTPTASPLTNCAPQTPFAKPTGEAARREVPAEHRSRPRYLLRAA